MTMKTFRLPSSLLIFFILLLHSGKAFPGSPEEISQPPDNPSPRTAWMRSVMPQALINANPRSPEGYRLLAARERADSQWVGLLKTVEKAERNGILDPFLCRQKAAAFLALGNFQENLNALIQAEIAARHDAD